MLSNLIINSKMYSIVRLLGKGKSAYSYLVKSENKLFVAKVIHHEKCDYYEFGDDKLLPEIKDYEILGSLKIRIPLLLDVDYGREIILKEFILGETIKEQIDQGSFDQKYLNQIEKMSITLKENGLNIDYYPTNFIVYHEEVYYIDYECNKFDERWSYENWGKAFYSLQKL